ncbi:iron-containing alcohol dehydrogenase [Clostridium sp. LBM24168]
MINIEIPQSYVSGKNILDKSGKYISTFGKYALIICGKSAWNKAGEKILMSFIRERVEYKIEKYQGYCTSDAVKKYSKLAYKLKVDVVLGVGGGKILDTAKAVGDKIGLPVITIPTVATNCAASSNVSIIYDDIGRYIEYMPLKNLPKLILTDIDLILESPIRYLNAGIGYTLSVFGYYGYIKQSESSVNMLKKYINGLYGELDEDINDEHYRKLIDSIVVLSGMIQNYNIRKNPIKIYNYISDNLTYISDTRYNLHGEKASFALIVQLVLENRSEDEIFKAIGLLDKLGLPITLNQLGIKYGSKIKIANMMDNICFECRKERSLIKKAIIKTDEMGNVYLRKKSSGNDQILDAIV